MRCLTSPAAVAAGAAARMGMSRWFRGWVVMAVLPAAVLMAFTGPGAPALAQSARSAASHPVRSAASPPGSGTVHRYIIILRNQNGLLAARSAARRSAVRAEQAPVIAQLRSADARSIASVSLVNAVITTVTQAGAAAVAADPAVRQVVPDAVIPGPSSTVAPAPVSLRGHTAPPVAASSLCGTVKTPQLNPEALGNINAVQAQHLGYDGAGVTVAYLADGINPANPDFQRNPAYASPGSPAGAPVITQYQDFSGDGTNAPTGGGEAFLDAGSIAAQGNQAYDLSDFVSPAHPLPPNCDIKIVGSAPGADVMALKVFAQNHDATVSGFLQAINYAVGNGAKVINESFGANNFPDTAADVIRQADDAAVAAGVTVVVSSGDAGSTSTIGSPASDPNVISVGATTTFRGYAQATYGGINDPQASGQFADNNISSISSGGFTQAGTTVDLVAPGDLNWTLCDPNTSMFFDCTNYTGAGSPIQFQGGTSESAPLTAGAAADVIQAYAATHGGASPSPALVKQILMSTATDIGAPAQEQGAGMLDVLAAVKLATSIAGTTAAPAGGLLASPGQVNVVQPPGATASRAITLTNTGAQPVTVALSTRALTRQVADQSGSFCMQPGTPTASCPANTGSFPIWSGVTEVYQEQAFRVPATTGLSRLVFSADYPFDSPPQTSLMHVALLEPDGTYAAYSLPQGLGDYAQVEVTNPPPGRWTAVFFTLQDGTIPGGFGTSGTVQWDATTFQYAPAGSVRPPSVTIGAGQTATARLTLTSPASSGDTAQSVVLATAQGQTTIPVTVRTIVPVTRSGGAFSGVLTGGNGRVGAEAQTNTYVFSVPHGETDLAVSVALANDPGDALIGYLVDPNGQTVGYSSNITTDGSFNPISTRFVTLYHATPAAGQWSLILQWLSPVTGSELQEPFTGTIGFHQVPVDSNLPQSGSLPSGQASTFAVTVHNTGQAPEAFFADPRLNQREPLPLPNQNPNVNADHISLPLPLGFTFPYYFVPTHTSQLQETLNGSVPVTFDTSYFPGDPDLSGAAAGDSASLTYSEPEISPGLWNLIPDEIGPYPATGAPPATASATFTAVTQAFDPAVTSSTGDAWSAFNGLTSTFAPVYVPPGGSATITVTITPQATPGTAVSGTLYLDDYTLASIGGVAFPNGDELAAIPYHYTVAP